MSTLLGIVGVEVSQQDESTLQFLPRVRALPGGSGGIFPQKILKIRYLRLAKTDFPP